jgi:glucosamine-6-phosphate deaminase
MVDRLSEVRKLLKMSQNEIIELSKNHLVVCDDLGALYQKFANDIANVIIKNNEINKSTTLILPVGPTGQYPVLAEIINRRNISLNNCWFFFMDEYCDFDGKALNKTHPLSFRRIAEERFFNLLRKNKIHLNENQIIFPDQENVFKLADKIKEVGGIDACFGGIGIHGHVAFNEPEKEVKDSIPRKVTLNNFTITINAIRAEVGGNLETFPKEAFTLGMKQILESNMIRLYCRNGTPYDWANTVLRIALLGEPNYDYPVTYIRNHPDYKIITDKDTLETPKNLI